MKTRKIKIISTSLVLVIIAGIFSFTERGDRYFEIAKNLDIFATLFKEVNAYYVDEVNPNTLMKTGIDAMLESLDPYTNYIPEDDIENFRTLSTGQYGGIGAQTRRINGKVYVRMIFEGTPAHTGGLKIGDEVVAIEDIPIKGLSRSEVSKLIKGQINTPVSLTVSRYNKPDDIKLQFKRKKITIKSVPYFGMIDNEIGYLKLTEFTMHAGRDVRNAVEDLKEQGAKKIILDLRDNPGGLLIEAVNIVNVFIPKGEEIVYTKGKINENNSSYKTLNNPVDADIPLVILINSGSASASEIVSGAVQDFDRGVLVGERSYGKGLVQMTRPLSYNSQLKVTTAKYYIPSGRSIQVIDYSHRKPDGSVGKIPESLKSAFKTRNGRVVYDGGGIAVDIEVINTSLPPIATSLLFGGLLFDYVTEYYYSHNEIAPASEFELSDKVYNEFINWLKDKNYSYTTKVEKKVEELTASAKQEKYYDEIKDDLIKLKENILKNKNTDLYLQKDIIKYLLEEEIVSRYYLEKGEIEVSFAKDVVLIEAINVFKNLDRYYQILSAN